LRTHLSRPAIQWGSQVVVDFPNRGFAKTIEASHCQWAPDGDEAFDDGSFVLHFDLNTTVRLIAFSSDYEGGKRLSNLVDMQVDLEEFYGTLSRWRASFEEEWSMLLAKESCQEV
jgi:hypothetical protein